MLMRCWLIIGLVAGSMLPAADATSLQASTLDLTRAVVVGAEDASGPARKAATMLVDEVNRRCVLGWSAADSLPPSESPLVLIARADHAAALARSAGIDLPDLSLRVTERYRIGTAMREKSPVVWVVGDDDRGVLYGAGRLLREMRFDRSQVSLASDFAADSAPDAPVRGIQLGYRPKTNSYDAWDLPQWEQYYRDMIIFGANAVELIPPRSDDEPDSPHFPRAPLEMMIAMSRLADEYDLDVWVWYPAMDNDYHDPKTVEAAVHEWAEVFRVLPRLDAVFVPGGDPGHAPPADLMGLLEKQAASLRVHHPSAKLWVSLQGFTQAKMEEFLTNLRAEPEWLGGIVHGPQSRLDLQEFRAAIPARYPVRDYPDITHTRHCQYPVPDWDVAFALAESREVSNPRPEAIAQIARRSRPHTIGGIVYSEGCHDDVNKCVWLAANWDPSAEVRDILRQYARLVTEPDLADSFAEGLRELEGNWVGPVLENASIDRTLSRFQDLERLASPRTRRHWRFNQALFRAYSDALVQARMRHGSGLYQAALQYLKSAHSMGSQRAIASADALLLRIDRESPAPELHARTRELAEALFQGIGAQLSVGRYNAIALERGASLDTLDVPLTDAAWLHTQLAPLTRLDGEEERLAALDALLKRNDPGPGGFYDDLGDPSNQPHLVRAVEWAADPAMYRSAFVGFPYRGRGTEGKLPRAWWHHAESLYDQPLEMAYDGLDPAASYRVRAVYARERPGATIRLDAEGQEVHGPIERPFEPLEFPIPRAATADGSLRLSWSGVAGRGGSGRGCQVLEVWLIKVPNADR